MGASPFVGGDSTGTEPLVFLVEGAIDTFRIDDLLDVTVPASRFFASIGSFQFGEIAEIDERFTVEELTGLDVPPDGVQVLVPPFVLPPLRRQLPEQADYEWVRFASGDIRLTVENQLPLPIGIAGSPGPALVVRLRDRLTQRTVLEAGFSDPIPPGGAAASTIPLIGVSAGNLLDLEIRGESAGSPEEAVLLRPEDAIRVRAVFENISADSAVAAIDPQDVSIQGVVGFDLGGSLSVLSGRVLEGRLPLVIENQLPLVAAGTLLLPELQVDGEALRVTLDLPRADVEPGRFETAVDLAGATIDPAVPGPLRHLRYELDAETSGSGGERVAISRRLGVEGTVQGGPLRLDWVESQSDRSELEIPSTVTEIDPPEALEQVEFTHAQLTLDVESRVALSADALLSLTGLNDARGAMVSIPLEFSIAAATPEAPARSIYQISELDSRILDLIHQRPDRLRLEGQAWVGSGAETAVLHRGDWIRGEYHLTAPLELKLDQVELDSDPFLFQVSEDLQNRIRDNLLGVIAQGTVINRFPAAVEAQIVFASSEDQLALDPEVVLEPVSVASGEIDAATGRAREAVDSAFEVAVPAERIGFFARDEVWGRFRLTVHGDASRTLVVTALDYAEIRAMLRFRVLVEEDL
jgi:hypothetical protein